MKINKIILTILILSIVTLVFSGCGGGNPVIPSPPDEPTEPIVPETTKVIEEETIQEIISVSGDQSTIVFKSSTPQLEELASGDIIAMGVTENTPEGLLRKVKNITKGAKDSSEVIVETEFVTLEEAVEQGEFNFDIPLQIKNIKEPISGIEGVKLITDKSKLKDSSHEFNYEINYIAYDGDGNPNTLVDNITLLGYISFDYDIIFSGKIESHELKNFILKSVVEIETNITISGGGNITVNILGKSFLPKPINLGTYTVWLGPVPVILSPSIDLKWDLKGGIYGTVTTGVTRTDTFTAGLEWNNGITQPIDDHNTSYDYIPPSTSKGGIIKFSIGPELMCKIYKVAGPYCNTGPYIKLIADISADPWWELQGGLAVLTGVKLEILKKTYLNVYLTVIGVSGTIAQADGPFGGTNHAPVISSLTANPSSININEATAITCTASDEDVGDILNYTWNKNGGTFEGSTSGSTIIWKAPPTKGNYTVTCEVSDGKGSDSETVNISVGDVNHPPAITSTPVTSATKDEPYSYDVNATDSDGDTLTYSLTTKPTGMTINSTTGLISWTPTISGNYNVTVKVFDGELFDTQSFTVKVEENGTTNQPPTLTLVGSGGVSPGSGTPSTTFTYSVYYSDPEGASPTVKNVYVDGSSHTMSGSGSGSTYTFPISGLSAGTHTYSFQFNDGTNTVNLPTSGTYSAPTVTSTVNQNVTLTLYICENSTSGPLLSGVSIGIVDGGGNSFGQTTNNSGYVTITGTPGTWNFSAMKSGYDTNNWSQSITTNCTKYGYIVKSATPVGAIDVFATLDGSYWIGSLSYSLTGPSSSSGSIVSAVLSNKPVGSYSIAFNSGGPSNASLSSITPSSTQTLSTGGIINFTFNFTGSTLLSPTGFSVSSYWNTVTGFPSMNLSWNAVSGATGYEMWVRPSGGSYASLGTRYAPYVTFNSNSLPGGARYVSGTTYYFKVRTVTASGTSDFTSEVSCVAAASPTTSLGQVQLSSPGNGFTLPPMNITFIWNFVSNATKYEIIIYNPLGQVALDQTTTNIHIIVALGTEETITWKVRAGDDSGNWGAWSSTWSLTIKTFT